MLSAVVKARLKRGALVTAANWEVVFIQFVAESAFKALLIVPVVGAAFLLALLAGGSVGDLLQLGVQEALAVAIASLRAHPGALASYLAGLLVVVLGGSVMMFSIKGGTVRVIVEAEAAAPRIEEPPLDLDTVRRAGQFTLERFGEGCDRYRRRFVRLGLMLLALYAVSGALYLVAMLAAYRVAAVPAWAIAGSMAAATASLAFGVWLTVVNLLYALVQVLVVAQDWPVRRATRALAPLLWRERRVVGAIFLAMLFVVVLATAASVLATGALGFIGFVPVVGLAVLPLQLLAWLARGLMFQFIGLTAMGAYAGVFRAGSSS